MSPYPKLHQRNLCDLYCIKISSNIKRNEWISTSIYPHHRHREIIFTAVLYPYQYLIVWSILNYQLYFLFKSIGQRYPLKRHTKLELHSLKSLTYFTALSTQVYHHLQQLPTYLSWICIGKTTLEINFISYLIRHCLFYCLSKEKMPQKVFR